MSELNFREYAYIFKPLVLLCYSEFNAGKEHSEAFAEQVPFGFIAVVSDDEIEFKNTTFTAGCNFILTKCSQCGAVNKYMPSFWYDRTSEFIEKGEEND